MERDKNITAGLDAHNDHTVIFDEDKRLDRAPQHPSEQFLQDMMMVIHIRPGFLKDHMKRDMIDGIAANIGFEL